MTTTTNKMLFLAPLLIFLSLPFCTPHMQMSVPPALGSKFNRRTTNPDNNLHNPLSPAQFPCHGHLPLLSTPQGASIATWSPGQTVSMTIVGGAPHGGGSCQASFSHDRGNSWTVAHTFLGACPIGEESSFSFRIPNDIPGRGGDVLFGWTWFNRIGNREMYMNCAVINLAGDGGGGGGERVAWNDRPGVFVANLGNGCKTVEMKDVWIPESGPDTTVVEGAHGFANPEGSCGVVPGGGYGGSDNGNGGGGGGGWSSGDNDSPVVEFGPGQTFTPGNDWPEGFQSRAARILPGILFAGIVAMVTGVSFLLAVLF